MQQALFELIPTFTTNPERARLLSPSAQVWLSQFVRYRRDDPRAAEKRDRLLESLLPLIKRTARAFWDRGSLEVEDLVQVGAIAALRAIESYKPTAGKTLAGYAKDLHIVPAMRRAIRAQKSDVRLTEDGQRYVWQIRRMEKEGFSIEEIAARIEVRGSKTKGLPLEKVIALRDAARLEHTGLDGARGERDEAPNAEERLGNAQVAAVVRRRVAHLDKVHRQIIKALFYGDATPEIDVLAKRFGVSVSEVQRMRDEALRQMRDIEEDLDGEI